MNVLLQGDPNVDYNTLLSRTKVLEARYTHMENTLREESRAKLSYYSAANEYKRQLDLQSRECHRFSQFIITHSLFYLIYHIFCHTLTAVRPYNYFCGV